MKLRAYGPSREKIGSCGKGPQEIEDRPVIMGPQARWSTAEGRFTGRNGDKGLPPFDSSQEVGYIYVLYDC